MPSDFACARCDFHGDDDSAETHARATGYLRCPAPGCAKSAKTNGLCEMHYTRLRRHGNLDGLRPFAPPAARFARYFRPGDPAACWEWTGATTSTGYGTFLVSNTPHVRVYAHRYAYECANGPIPAGQFAMHACDNRPCVNPSHLSLGTHRDNMRDMAEKGRSKRATCARGHQWTPENTQQFLTAAGYVTRRCRQCRRNRERKSAA